MLRCWMLVLLIACGPSDEVPELSVSGSGGVPEFSWSGRNVEVMNFDRDGVGWVAVQPVGGPATTCTNALEGRPGVTWGAWPAGYETVDYQTGELLVVPSTLEDGTYSVGLSECVEATEGFASYQQDAVIRFTVAAGVVEFTE